MLFCFTQTLKVFNCLATNCFFSTVVCLILLTHKTFFSVAPKIISPMNDMEIKNGEVLHIEVKFVGAPTPSISWTLDDSPLKTDKRVTISNYENYTLIHAINTKRLDTGIYCLKLKNESGSDEGSMKVTILGKFISYFAV